MKRIFYLLAIILLVTLANSSVLAAPPSPQIPKRLVIGTLKPGSAYFSCTLGLALIINRYTGLKTIVQPYPTAMSIFPHLRKGDVHVSFMPVENLEAYAYGIRTLANPEDKQAYPELRLLMGGYHMYVGWVTRPDTGIKTVSDLKGHKVFWKSKAGFMNVVLAEDSLRAFGLDPEKDVESVVGYENMPAAYKALQTKKFDALFGPIGGSMAEELQASTGAVVLSFPEEKLKAMRVPTSKVVTIPPGYLPGVKEPTTVLARQNMLYTHKDLPEQAAYLIIKTIIEHHMEVASVVLELRDWGKKGALPPLSNIVIPFHPGAIKYYKEQGMWNPQLEARNKEMLEKIQKITKPK